MVSGPPRLSKFLLGGPRLVVNGDIHGLARIPIVRVLVTPCIASVGHPEYPRYWSWNRLLWWFRFMRVQSFQEL